MADGFELSSGADDRARRAAALNKKRKKALLAAGLCMGCGKQPIASGKCYCVDCLRKRNSYYKARIAAGLCGQGCGQPIAPGSDFYCSDCLAKKRQRCNARIAAGLCVNCGKQPIAPVSKSYCADCFATRREWGWSKQGILNAEGKPFLIQDYETLLAKQGGVCAGCFTPKNGKEFDVDHVHGPDGRGPARALVCSTCNAGPIKAFESRKRRLRGIAYLAQYDPDELRQTELDIHRARLNLAGLVAEVRSWAR